MIGDWDEGQVYYVGVNENNKQNGNKLVEKFVDFVKNFKNKSAFIYRDQLKQHIVLKQYYLEINLEDLAGYDNELYDNVVSKPNEILPLVSESTTLN